MSEKHTTDVIIIGGGVIGCAIAYYLRKAGVAVTVVEKGSIAAEASQAAAGLLAPLGELSETEPYAQLILASWKLFPELFAEIEALSGVRVEFQRPGSLRVLAPVEREAYARLLPVWRELGLEATLLTGAEARAREPLLSEHVEQVLYAPQEASIKPELVTRAFAGAAQKLGASFYEHTEVTGLLNSSSRVTGICTAEGTLLTGNTLVLAAGAWSAICAGWLGLSLPVSPMRGQILALRQPARQPLKHILFSEEVYMVPKLDNTVYVGATVEEVGFDKSITAGGVNWLLSSAIQLAPALEHAAIERIWSGLRPWSPDSQPILGRAPGWENVILATGHSATGFELSAITGKTIAELLTSGQTPEPIRAFGLERFTGTV